MASAPRSSSQPAPHGDQLDQAALVPTEDEGAPTGRRARSLGAPGEVRRGEASPTRRVWLGLALVVYLAWLGFLAWLAWRTSGETPQPRPGLLAPAPAARENRAP